MSMMSESMSMTSLKNGGQGRVILYALSRDLSRDQQPAQTGLPLVLAHRNNRAGQNVRNPQSRGLSASAEELFKFQETSMADWGGFEPPTPWFVAKYSIQLSYQSAPRRARCITFTFRGCKC